MSRKLERNDLHGRRMLICSLKENELTAEKIIEVLPQLLELHEQNAEEIRYLNNYYKGIQPILNKTKVIRPEINNKVESNHAFEIVEFKKAYVYGEPVQYVQKGEKDNDKVNPKISILNRFMESEDKASLDKELAEWNYKVGTAYRWVDVDSENDKDEAPFEIAIPDPARTFVVYSNDIKPKQLFSGYISYFSKRITDNNEEDICEWREYTIYTSTQQIRLTNEGGTLGLKKDGTQNPYPLLPEGHRIIEYPLNSSRIGLIELVMSQLNALNRITSSDIDGIEQFVQSLLVFINQEVDIDTYRKLIKEGAIQVTTSTPDKPADVKLLTSQLVHSETKIVIDKLYDDILTTVGIPRLNDKPSGGDTGQARLLGEGWTMADERAKQDELSFKKSERQFLKLILEICKEKLKGKKNNLNGLKISNIDIKFTRNKSDNLLVKTQGLLNMQSAQVPPDIAFAICGLFSDPNEVYAKGKVYYGEDFWKKQDNASNLMNNKINAVKSEQEDNTDSIVKKLPQLGGQDQPHKTTNKSE